MSSNTYDQYRILKIPVRLFSIHSSEARTKNELGQPRNDFSPLQKMSDYSQYSSFSYLTTTHLRLRQLKKYNLVGSQQVDFIIFVMSYLNHDYSLSYSIQQPADSNESQAEFLKVKLIETHSKLIQELEYSKRIEEQLAALNFKLQTVNRSNQQLTRRLHTLNSKQERTQQDKLKQLELNLVESQKKNDLLRGDLQTMRNKTLELVSTNQRLQQQCSECERSNSKLTQRLNVLNKELKLKEISQEEYRQEAQRYRLKYDKQVSNNQQIEAEIQDAKSQKEQLMKRNEDLQFALKQEREKQNKSFNQILLLQKENKDWKIKAEEALNQLAKNKEELYQIKMRTKGEERNLVIQLQRLTHDYNNLQLLLKQRQTELESARFKNAESYSKRKSTFQHTKELVGKLEREESKLINTRTSPTRIDKISPRQPKTTIKTYKQQKEDYLSMIESVGSMQSQMLNCNMEKKKILAQIDKIDETRIKTKEMISKRRRLEVELQNQQRKIEHIRGELKKMKVM